MRLLVKTPSTFTIPFLVVLSAVVAVGSGCQTTAPVKPLVAKPVTDLPNENLTGKQLTIVGNTRYASVVLRPEKRFVLTPSAQGQSIEGEWQRKEDKILLLNDVSGEMRNYSVCRVKELNGQLCLYYETEGQFVDKKARQEIEARRAAEIDELVKRGG